MEERKIYAKDDLSVKPWMRGARYAGPMDKEAMMRNLYDINEVFKKHKIPFILIFGGLIGAMRNGDLIDYDTDLDLGVFETAGQPWHHAKMKEVKADLVKLGFYVADSNECWALNDWFIRDGERIEIFWFIEVDAEGIYTDTIRYKKEYFQKIGNVKLNGLSLSIPVEWEKMLVETYGQEWKIPQVGKKGYSLKPSEIEKRNKIYRELAQLNQTMQHLRKQL